MRIGNYEIPGGLLVMPAFAVVIAILVLWTWYYYAKQRGEMRTLAASRGWQFLGKEAPEFRQVLGAMAADTSWISENIIVVEGSPNKVYLFNYQSSSRTSADTSEIGTGCLAERSHALAGELVVIDPRPPLIGKLVEKLPDEWVQVGGPEFQEMFLVRSGRADVAAANVTSGVQEALLLRRTANLKWSRVWIAGRRVLVTVTYRLKPTEWDELIDLTKRLRAALP